VSKKLTSGGRSRWLPSLSMLVLWILVDCIFCKTNPVSCYFSCTSFSRRQYFGRALTRDLEEWNGTGHSGIYTVAGSIWIEEIYTNVKPYFVQSIFTYFRNWLGALFGERKRTGIAPRPQRPETAGSLSLVGVSTLYFRPKLMMFKPAVLISSAVG